MNYTFVITATVENDLAALQRMASLMQRNRLKMQQINVIGFDHVSHISLALCTDEETMEKLFKQLNKLVDLSDLKVTHKTRS